MTTMNPTQPPSNAPTAIAGLIGASAAGALVWFGLPLLGALERGVGPRVGVALLAALAVGGGAALIVRGRASAAAIEAAALEGASDALLAHRARRAQVFVLSFVVAAVCVLLAGVGVTLFYGHLDADRMPWDPEHVVGTFEYLVCLGVGVGCGLTFYFLRRPGSFVDEEPLPESLNLSSSEQTVSEAELDETARLVRANMRRASLAKVAGVGVAFGVLVLVGYASSALDAELPTALYLFAFAGALGLGALAYRALAPKTDVDELFEEPLAASERAALGAAVDRVTATLEETLAGAGRLTIKRSSSALSLLGMDAGRRYTVDADDVALATAGETLPLWMRLLPARLLPYRAMVEDDSDGEPLRLSAGPFAFSVDVTLGDERVGRLRKAPFLRRLYLHGADGAPRLEIRGSLWFRREMSILRKGEKVGYVQVFRPHGGIIGLLSGQEVTLDLEVPSDATVAERQLLLASLPLLDRRHY